MPRIKHRSKRGYKGRHAGMLSIYGTGKVWRQRRDGHWQRYKTSVRFDFEGTRRQLARARSLVDKRGLVPKQRFVRVTAQQFLDNPAHYARRGVWRLDDVAYRMKRRRRRR